MSAPSILSETCWFRLTVELLPVFAPCRIKYPVISLTSVFDVFRAVNKKELLIQLPLLNMQLYYVVYNYIKQISGEKILLLTYSSGKQHQ